LNNDIKNEKQKKYRKLIKDKIQERERNYSLLYKDAKIMKKKNCNDLIKDTIKERNGKYRELYKDNTTKYDIRDLIVFQDHNVYSNNSNIKNIDENILNFEVKENNSIDINEIILMHHGDESL